MVGLQFARILMRRSLENIKKDKKHKSESNTSDKKRMEFSHLIETVKGNKRDCDWNVWRNKKKGQSENIEEREEKG